MATTDGTCSAGLVAVTVTPGSTAPLSSVTCPLMVAVPVCAKAARSDARNRKATIPARMSRLDTLAVDIDANSLLDDWLANRSFRVRGGTVSLRVAPRRYGGQPSPGSRSEGWRGVWTSLWNISTRG